MLPIRKQEDDNLFELLRELYRTAYAITGYKIDKERILEIDIPATLSLLKELHPRRDKDDLQKAVKWGALGRYGEYTGINAKTFISWLDSYVESPDFKDKLKESKTPPPQLPAPDLDTNKVWSETVAEYTKTRQTPKGAAALHFNIANKLGLFNWKDEDFIEECKYKARVVMLDRARQAEDIAALRHLKDELKNEEGEPFKAECRRQAVRIVLEKEIKKTC